MVKKDLRGLACTHWLPRRIIRVKGRAAGSVQTDRRVAGSSSGWPRALPPRPPTLRRRVCILSASSRRVNY